MTWKDVTQKYNGHEKVSSFFSNASLLYKVKLAQRVPLHDNEEDE